MNDDLDQYLSPDPFAAGIKALRAQDEPMSAVEAHDILTRTIQNDRERLAAEKIAPSAPRLTAAEEAARVEDLARFTPPDPFARDVQLLQERNRHAR